MRGPQQFHEPGGSETPRRLLVGSEKHLRHQQAPSRKREKRARMLTNLRLRSRSPLRSTSLLPRRTSFTTDVKLIDELYRRVGDDFPCCWSESAGEREPRLIAAMVEGFQGRDVSGVAVGKFA